MNTTPMRIVFSVLIAAAFVVASPLQARSDEDEAVESLQRAVSSFEKEGYEFRQQAWVGELKLEMGRAVRMQLFKGLDYRICVSLPTGTGAKVAAMLLDGEGKPMGKAEPESGGQTVVISAKPKRTGVYAVAIRLTEGRKSATCAMTAGWK